jgi:hypothetical protein
VLLSILAMTLIGLAINKAAAGEQTRFYGPDGRSIDMPRPAAIRRHSTVLTGGAQVAPRPAEIRPRSMVLMAGGLTPQRQQANAKAKTSLIAPVTRRYVA